MNTSGITSNNADVAILVHSCDRYELLYKGFSFFFSTYWDNAINGNYYFATEVKQPVIPKFTTINSGEGAWADRLKKILINDIKEEYVLYFQEDMWLEKKVNAHFFNQLFVYAKEHDCKQIKLHSADVYKTIETRDNIEGFNIALLDNQQSDYLMSHQVTLWKKDFLLQQLHKNEHPWRNERKGTQRLKALNPKIFHVDYFAENGYGEINNNDSPVLRSSYQTISHNATLNNNVLPFIEAMKASETHANYALQLEHNYQLNLTHDGLSKPHKTDVFKKVKQLLLGK